MLFFFFLSFFSFFLFPFVRVSSSSPPPFPSLRFFYISFFSHFFVTAFILSSFFHLYCFTLFRLSFLLSFFFTHSFFLPYSLPFFLFFFFSFIHEYYFSAPPKQRTRHSNVYDLVVRIPTWVCWPSVKWCITTSPSSHAPQSSCSSS